MAYHLSLQMHKGILEADRCTTGDYRCKKDDAFLRPSPSRSTIGVQASFECVIPLTVFWNRNAFEQSDECKGYSPL